MFTIRPVRPEDAPRLLEIYSYYIQDTAVTFEWDVPSAEDWLKRIEAITEKHPYFVCEVMKDKTDSLKPFIVGYAYAHTFNERKAYDWTLETSIYIDKEFRGNGAGPALYEELEKKCREMGIKSLLAKICYAKKEDEYITHASVKFHKKHGYRKVGFLDKVGLKFDRWYDIVMMQKKL